MINWVKEYSEEELNTMITKLVDGVVDGIIERYNNDDHELTDDFDMADALSEYGVAKKDAYYWFDLEDYCRWSFDGYCELSCEGNKCDGTWNEKRECSYCIESGIV